MCTREPVPDRRDGGDHPEQKPLGQLLDSEHELWSRPGLTIAEAARTCGVSASTIRRYLAAGRFPTAHQQPSPIPGQRGLWRIPTQDLLAAGLRPGQARLPDQEQNNEPRAAEPPASLVLTGFESSSTPWSLSGPVAEPPRPGRRAGHTIQSLEGALAALRAHHAGPPPNSDRAAPSPTPPSGATDTAGPALRPGMLPMVPKRRPAKRELSQEKKAAIIGRALSRQRPPRRRWL